MKRYFHNSLDTKLPHHEIARVGNTVCHRGVQETEALRPLLMLVDAFAAFT